MITIFVITVLFTGNSVFAAKMKISEQEVERIKTALGFVSTVSNIGSIILDGGNLTTILNTAISGGRTATDATYGLLVLSAINEMEFMDLVLSQEYKDIAINYFTKVLDERTNLRSYWKGVGFDMPRVVAGTINSPIGALTLNTFEMTDKVISILTAFNNLQTGIRYDGLWYYFDFRRGGDSHEEAWALVEEQMGWAAKPNPFMPQKLTKNNYPQLEQQFAALWYKYGPHVTSQGLSQKYKEQVKSDLRQTLATAIEENTRVQPVYVKEVSAWDKLLAQLEKIKNNLIKLTSRIWYFAAGPIVKLEKNIVNTDATSKVDEETSDIEAPEINVPEFILESTEIADNGLPQAPQAEEAEKIMDIGYPLTHPLIVEVEPPSVVVQPSLPELQLCERGLAGAARQYRALINEVAWMGDKESTSNEWIELKNIFGLPLNLQGWQMQDKDQQIKKNFSAEDIIPVNGYILLQRTKDYSGALNNTDEALYLFDNNCQLEDEVLANFDWPAGNNVEKKPMQRYDGLYWYTQEATPGAENLAPLSPIYSSGATPASTPAPQPSAPSNLPSFTVLINEIAWSGTKANSADEWLELYNTTNSTIDLVGWTLKAADDAPSLTFSTSSIPAKGYFLLERTDDTTVNDISADFIYTGALGNDGEKLELRDAGGNLIDFIDNSSGWAAGQASPNYISMERVNSSTWAGNNRISRNGLDADGNQINGTPRAENSVSKSSTQIPSNFTITEDLTLTYLGSPYLVEGSFFVSGAKLTIEPGVTVKFKHVGSNNQNALLKVEDGTLEAVGTASQKITFTSSITQPAAGDWDGLYLKNSNSTINNAVINYGGKLHQPCCYEWTPYTFGAVYIDGGNAQIINSLIEKSGTFGLWLKNSTTTQIASSEFKDNQGADYNGKAAAVLIENSNPTIKDSIFSGNTVGILAENYSSPAVRDNQFIQNTTPIQITSLLTDISGNTFQNNNIDGVLVASFGFSGDNPQEITWKKINVPYFIDSHVIISSGYKLIVNPGVEVRLKNNGRVDVDGTLEAIGTAQDKIVFTGASQIAGSWKYIKFSASSASSTLENVTVSYGGYWDEWGGARYGAVKIDGLSLSIKDSTFENNRTGIEFINGNLASQSQNISVKNNGVGVYVSAGNCPSLSAITFGSGNNANTTYNVFPENCGPQ
ncbi:MAG: lamin tail domain-containing protein [Candidatus Nealsonbacteria bacterium]|nr:lamin tail domain-containing protein [Candidatus Nealsonbacteria bacterium]